MRFGSYMRTTRLIDYAPYTLIDVGEMGRVVAEVEGLVILRLTKHHPGLGEGNTVSLMPEDAAALRPAFPPIRPWLPWAALGATVTACVVAPWLQPSRAVTSKEMAQAWLKQERTAERVIYADGLVFVCRYRFAGDSVVGLLLSKREITPDEVPAEASRIRAEMDEGG